VLSLNRLLVSACLLCLYPVGSLSQPANRFDIIINELLPDPSPVIGLPNSEFIELKNNSSTPFSLRNWRLSDGSSTATINTDFIVEAGAYVIICPNAAVTEYSRYGNTIGVPGFPSLNNDRDLLILYSPEGKIIHAVEYSVDWYQNDIKREGGWSLEMIDTHNPCGGLNNWKSSIDAAGGTPGKTNSVNDINPDERLPALIRTYTIDSATIVAVFDEPVDSSSASVASNYNLNGIGNPSAAYPVSPLFNEVVLKFSISLSPNTVYRLIVANVGDCTGNSIGMFNNAPVGISSSSSYFDIVINEILFNPPPAGHDYIELYNRSKKVVNLQQLYVCNKNAVGSFTNIKQLSDKPLLFFPGDYCIIAEDIDWLRTHYPVKGKPVYIQLSALPSMPDDKEHLAILNWQGEPVDQLQYDQQWHFALLDNDEGVSLERINYNDSTQHKNNWISAAATAGFGTPGYQNSQFRADLVPQGLITIFPKVFSPGNAGFTTISCRLTEPGHVVNIFIYDDNGRLVRKLISNTTMGLTANFNWDGLSDQQKKLPMGHYIIFTEIFNLQGKTKKFKNVVTLAAGL
jgi:hypothetical protein